jgi:RHS repeat-associated protein
VITYFSLGAARSTSGTLNTDERFTGQRLDQDGLYYYGARYYDATIGRFISADSIVPNPANPQSLNRYSYCYNNPLKYTDPTGHLFDIFVDAFFIGYDIYSIAKDPGDWTNWASLGLDVGCAVLPFVTGGGQAFKGAVKLADRLDDAADAARTTERLAEAARIAEKSNSAAKAGVRLTEATKAVDRTHDYAKTMGVLEKTALHGNDLRSLRPTWGYKLFKTDGTFLKNGITSKAIPETRYSRAFMRGKYMEAHPFPDRLSAYRWEEAQNRILRGPLNLSGH